MIKSSSQPKRIRLDMRFPKDLLRWLQKYAQTKRKTVTQIFVDHAVDLKERDG